MALLYFYFFLLMAALSLALQSRRLLLLSVFHRTIKMPPNNSPPLTPVAKRLKTSGDEDAAGDAMPRISNAKSTQLDNSKQKANVVSLKLVSFNMARCQPSQVAPPEWTQDDSLQAMEKEILQGEPDIIALQEAPPFALDRKRIFSEFQLIGSQTSHAPHVALFVHEQWNAKRILQDSLDSFDFEGLPAVMAEIDISSKPKDNDDNPDTEQQQQRRLWVASVHLEPFAGGAAIRKRQLQALSQHARAANVPLIIAGDTNMRVSEDSMAEGDLGLQDLWKFAGSDFQTKYTVSVWKKEVRVVPFMPEVHTDTCYLPYNSGIPETSWTRVGISINSMGATHENTYPGMIECTPSFR